MPPVMILTEVAIAAPLTPILSGKIRSQSKKTFSAAGMILHHMA